MKDVKLFMRRILIFLVIACASCSLFDGMRKNSFSYRGAETLPLFVPKGYKKMELQTDSAGNKKQVFSYSGGGELYFYYGDTTKEHIAFDTSMNIPKYYPGIVLFYKGQDNRNGLFWRENRYKNFRFGYKNISIDQEALFDSSLNYMGWQVVKN